MKGLVVIPTYNEKENIEQIVSALLALEYGLDILIVDDNSPDGTGEIADRLSAEHAHVNVLHRERKQGIGPAYIAGFTWGLAKDYEIFIQMDADFSHRPHYIGDFLNAVEDSDLVLGSRYIKGVNVINWPLSRLLISYFANQYSRLATGVPVRDATGGFKCFRRKALEAIDLERIHSSGYMFQIEMTMRVHAKGLVVREIPIVFYDRTKGTSKMSLGIAGEAGYMVWLLRIKKLLGKL